MTVDENDEPEIVLSTPALTVEEGPASSTTYTIMLSHKPVQNVNVKITGFVPRHRCLTLTHRDRRRVTRASVISPRRTGTRHGYQTVTTGTAAIRTTDAPVDHNEPATLTHTASGGEYGGGDEGAAGHRGRRRGDRRVGLQDRDTLSVEEGNATGTTYTVRLTSEPTGTVTVDITGHDGTDLRLSTTTLTATQDPDAVDLHGLQLEHRPVGHRDRGVMTPTPTTTRPR